MGGVVRAVETGVQKTGQALGISRRPSPQPAQATVKAVEAAPAAPEAPAMPPTARQQEDIEQAAKRRSRRRGRALLSEVRLNPEEGIGQTTLGTGTM
jgi:hypothetical protein